MKYLDDWSDRYTATDGDFVLDVRPYNGPGRASLDDARDALSTGRRAERAKKTTSTSHGAYRDIKGRPLGWLVVAALLAAALRPVIAQEPTFRSGVDLVTVDATVLGADGSPLEHLGPDDFRLDVDGRPRRVISAQFVSQAAPATRPRLLAASHFTSNENADAGRLVIVAVDEAHIRRLEGRRALQAAATFIDTLDGADSVGVTGLTRLGALELTRDHAALKRRLGTFVGQADSVFLQFNIGLSEALEIADGSRTRLADAVLRECGRALTEYMSTARTAEDASGGRDACPEQVEQESRAFAQHARTQARISLAALDALLASLKDIDGPKTVVLLSEGLVADPRYLDVAKIAAAAQASRVSIYVLQLDTPIFEAAQHRVSPTFSRDLQVGADGLARIAGAARGAVFRLVGNDPRPFERIARELSGYYLLAFEPLDTERDGRSHRIQVALARGGGELRSRPAFTLPVARPSSRSRDERLVTLLRTMRPATELPIRVATYTYVEPGSPQLRVVVSAEVDAASGLGAQVLLGFVLIDSRGVIAATAARDVDSGRYAFSAVVPPGSYALRVGAIDALGRQGSVQRPFDARVVTADGLQVTDLILARVTARSGDPLEPLIDRVSGAAVVAYLELHAAEGQSLPDATVRVEMARGEADSALVSMPAELTRRDGGWVIARAIVPIASMPPGNYVARAEVVASGHTVARVMRPFSIAER